MIRFIAALDSTGGIADDTGIPWQGKLPTDVAYFREKTLHGNVMMGAGWYKEQLKPLPDRRNLVATSDSEPLRPGFEKVEDARQFLLQYKGRGTNASGVQGESVQRSDAYRQYGERVAQDSTQQSAVNSSSVVSSAGQQADVLSDSDVWVGGGAGLFASTLDLADELYITQLDQDFHCTKFFPEFTGAFELVQETSPQTENGITYRFQIWQRSKKGRDSKNL